MAAIDPTRKLIQDLSVELLSKLSAGVVKQVTEIPSSAEDKEKKPKAVKKKDVVAGIIKEIERVGIKRLADALNIADAQKICKTVGVDFKDKDYPNGEANKGRKNVVSKRLGKHVAAKGLEEVLTLLKEDQQTAVLAALELPDSSGTARAIAIRISNEVRRTGAEIVLSKMDTRFLKDLGEELSLEVEDISSQPTIIKAILTGKVPPKRSRPEKKQEPISKKKPKLEAGISIADMFQHYNLTELLDFARDNDIKPINGKKSEVMKRIHAFFEGQTEPAAKKPKKEVKKESAKKPKKEEVVEEEEEVEEEAPKEKASPAKGKAKPKKDSKKDAKKEVEPEPEASDAELDVESDEEAVEEVAEEVPVKEKAKATKKDSAKKPKKDDKPER